MRQNGFTLVEILVALGIAGVVVVAALTPLTYTVRVVGETTRSFASSNKERNTVARIFQDVRETVDLQVKNPVRLLKGSALEEEASDSLLLWTSSPTYSGGSVSCVVYAILERTVLTDMTAEDGLYRWVLKDAKTPSDFNPEEDRLDPANGRLLLPGVTGLRLSALQDDEWVDEYDGAMPRALRVALVRDEEESVYETFLPRF